MEIRERAVLITGGRRIGAVVAQELATHGADIALSYRRSNTEADEAARTVRSFGRRAVTLGCDLTRPGDCLAVVARAAGALGRLDVLVHMASVFRSTPYDQLTEQDWDESMAVDLRAAYLCAKAAVPHFRAAGGGRIIVVSDWTARSGRPRYKGFLPYHVAKRSVIALIEALALEWAEDGILVNAVAPGPIVAPVDLSDRQRAAVEAATPLGTWGGELEIARAVVGLIETDFITGETVRVDGGRHLR